MTTPPSSPALSEARDEARAYVMGHRSEPDGPVWPDQRGLAAIDNLIALAHASGLAAGREERNRELEAEARSSLAPLAGLRIVKNDLMPRGELWVHPHTLDPPDYRAALDSLITKMAALRSPGGG